jgi:hypothetical protein
MGTRFRILRLDRRNEDGSVALHVGVALDVTNRSDLDNCQTTVSATLSRSNCIAGVGEMRPSADHGCAEAVPQGG